MGKLYKLVSGLMGRNKENPLPTCVSEKQLAEDFLEYFVQKINKIRTELDAYPLFQPNSTLSSDLDFSRFDLISEDELIKVISTSKSTTCESDPVP